MKKLTTILAVVMVGVFLVTGSAMALPFNERPVTVNEVDNGESSLQEIFDIIVGENVLDAANDQSNTAIWSTDEGDVSSYKIVSITAGTGSLGIYSYTDPTKTALLDFDSRNASFGIDVDGELWGDVIVGDSDDLIGFGDSFGFFWNNLYTEDDKNNNDEARALSYVVKDGTAVDLTDKNLYDEENGIKGDNIQFLGGFNNTFYADGNNDWILAFEDGSDGDFQDAVFLVEDMKPVPEPATMLLLGSGLLGMGAATRRRKKQK